ncbi:hypothetical protein [Streptomyces chumphonensis]|uniref:hypothetical protein n=1 Tax=Streptomyces chumphonensis TaxID=1214925 RepID=UPI003D71EC85
MAEIGYAHIPVPGGADAPVGPGNLGAMAQAIDPHLIHHVVDQAERDEQYSDAPLHTAVSADDGSLWIKTSATATTWAVIWEPDPAWRPVTLLSGYTGGAYRPEARRIGNQVWLRGRIERTDESAVVPNNGIAIGSVPADCIPQDQVGSLSGQCSLAGDIEIGVGKLEVLEANSASSYGSPGTLVWWNQDTGPETTKGVAWVNISGTYWID